MIVKGKYSILSLVLLLLCAFDTELGNEDEIWIDGGTFYKALKHEKEATIYFEEWNVHVNQFLEDPSYFVALQLDHSFDPLPDDAVTLPTLRTLAAVGDEVLLADYFNFLESFGRTHGINHMVMPDTANFSALEKEVIALANEHSPYYFLSPSVLSHAIPDSKKEYRATVNQPKIWIADQDVDTKRIERWSQKKETGHDFYRSLRASKEAAFTSAFEFPSSLSTAIFSSAVVALDPTEVLPLTDRSITYLGSDLKLRRILAQYVKVFDYRVSGVKCIVDVRTQERKVIEGDIILQNELQLEGFTSLVLPDIYIADLEIEVAKMLFGAKGIIGKSTSIDARSIPNPKYLGFTNPSIEGIDKDRLSSIDSLAMAAVKMMATPGIQMAIVKNGNLVAEKSYGYYTYDSIKEVTSNTIYDIASVTKVVATLPAVGYLLDHDLVKLDDSISMHLPEFAGSNKAGVTIEQLLAHNAGL
ncbi:MAG: beta-lactamase family protein, partial [Ekhidna sp.]|nr:beta-lactamase family protein [Ekhidna sp.]